MIPYSVKKAMLEHAEKGSMEWVKWVKWVILYLLHTDNDFRNELSLLLKEYGEGLE